MFGDGKQSRDFTHVDNVVAANLAAMDAPGAIAGVYNVACGASTSVFDLIQTLNELLSTTLEPVFEPARSGEIPWSLANISNAIATFGYKPEIDLREGLARTVEWYTPQEASTAEAT